MIRSFLSLNYLLFLSYFFGCQIINTCFLLIMLKGGLNDYSKKRQHMMSRFVHRRVWIFIHRYRVGEKYTRTCRRAC